MMYKPVPLLIPPMLWLLLLRAMIPKELVIEEITILILEITVLILEHTRDKRGTDLFALIVNTMATLLRNVIRSMVIHQAFNHGRGTTIPFLIIKQL